MNLNKFLILLLIFLCEKVFADNQIFLEDRPASYCSIYTSTAVKILYERLKGMGKDDVIINNQSLGMGKKYNENLIFLVKKIYSDNYNISSFSQTDSYISPEEKFTNFAILVYEKCLLDKYHIDPWNEYLMNK